MYNKYYIFIIIILIIIISIYLFIKYQEKFDNKILPNIYYINLEHRLDRKKNFISEFKQIDYPINKLIRINAVKHNIGTLGCLQSHILALKTALNETNNIEFVIICEDDFIFRKRDNNKHSDYFYSLLENNFKDWNVILLSFTGKPKKKYKNIKLNDFKPKNFRYIWNSHQTAGYLIKKSYIPILLDFWEKLYDKTKDYKETPSFEEHIDVAWWELQDNKWFSYKKKIGTQLPSYSDIEKSIKSYR